MATALAPSLILIAPFLAFAKFHQYRWSSPEILAVLMLLTALGALCSVLLFSGRKDVRVLLTAGLLTTFLDFHTEWGLKIHLAAFLACLLLAWLLRDHILEIMFAAFLVFLTSTLLLPGGRGWTETSSPGNATGQRGDLPPILHLVLDEHIGIEGIPTEVAGGSDLREELKSFYRSRGFRLFGGAFAQYVDSYNSLSNLFNLTDKDVDRYYFESRQKARVLKANAYFRRLVASGYRIRVYQADYIDYCQPDDVSVDFCLTYPSNSIKSIEDTQLDSWQKVKLITNSFLSKSTMLADARAIYNAVRQRVTPEGWRPPPWDDGVARVGPVAVLRALQRVQADLQKSPGGTVFFAHLLIPHYPYVYDAKCDIKKKVARWLYRNTGYLPSPQENDDRSRTERYAEYFDQIRCQQNRLHLLLQSIRAAGVFDAAIVIIHGDHGSRIVKYSPTSTNLRYLSQQDYVDAYSTLFAVKAPWHEPGYDLIFEPINRLFQELLERISPSESQASDTRTGRQDRLYVFVRREPFGRMARISVSRWWVSFAPRSEEPTGRSHEMTGRQKNSTRP